MGCLLSSLNRSLDSRRHTRGSGHPDVFAIPGFRLALAIASLAGMTFDLLNELGDGDTTPDIYWQTRINGRALGIESRSLAFNAQGPNEDYRRAPDAVVVNGWFN